MDTPGERLKWAREKKGYAKATDAARAHGWKVPTYLGHENGDRNPSRDAAKRYGKGLKVPWVWILEGGPLREDNSDVEVPIAAFVGAGDAIESFEDGEPIAWVKAPPELIDGQATEVRGRSMLPFYSEGDLLFHKEQESEPRKLVGQVVVVRLKDGRRFIKHLQPGKRGKFNLASVNPAYPTMEDQTVVWAAKILWVKKR